MKIHFSLLKLAFLLLPLFGLSQTATLKGIILDSANLPIANINIKAGTEGTSTNENGFYLIKIPANEDVLVEFTHLNYKKVSATFNLKNGETFEFNPVMNLEIEQIAVVVVKVYGVY